MLLDQLDGVDVVSLIQDELSAVWSSETSGIAGSQALDASLELISDVLTGHTELGKRPKDLPAVLTRMAIGGLGVCSLRALARGSRSAAIASSEVRLAAGEAAWGLRAMFNRPEATLVVRGKSGRRPQTRPYWRDVLNYCCDGALQGVLDEYMLLLLEQPEEPGDSATTYLDASADQSAKPPNSGRSGSRSTCSTPPPSGEPASPSHARGCHLDSPPPSVRP